MLSSNLHLLMDAPSGILSLGLACVAGPSKKQIDVSLRTRCVVLKQSQKSEGIFPGSLELLSWNRLHKNTVSITKRVVVAPFELKHGPNESYGRAASVGTPPGAQKAQIRPKNIVKLQGSAAWAQPLKFAAPPAGGSRVMEF